MTQNTGREVFFVAAIMHSKSSNKINIPISYAEAMGFDKADKVIITRKGDNKLEVKRYDGPEDLKEYIQAHINKSN